MVRVLIITILLLSNTVSSQREVYVRSGLINASATISPTLMLNRSESNYYLSGFLEGRLDNHISVRGETHYFIDGNLDIPYLAFASRTYCGFLYHLSKENLDSHVGFMPGLSVLQMNGDLKPDGGLRTHVVPSFSMNMGVTYYVWKFFNFFANVTYVHSTANHFRNNAGRSDELMISAGLGFNINTIKAK